MKTYLLTLFNSILIDIDYIYNTYTPYFILKYLYILKLEFINLILTCNFSTHIFFFSMYLILIIILTNYIYKLWYNNICYINFDLIYDVYISLKQLKFFIISNKYETKFLYYYKTLFQINLKQFLIGTGVFFFFLILYQLFIGIIELVNTPVYDYHLNQIYNSYFINTLNFSTNFFQFYYINILYTFILIYIFLHILFGIFNIFYDYLKDIAFILFFLSFFILIILFNIYFIHNNIDFYLNFIKFFSK
jgi:hypothetical protein